MSGIPHIYRNVMLHSFAYAGMAAVFGLTNHGSDITDSAGYVGTVATKKFAAHVAPHHRLSRRMIVAIYADGQHTITA
jgi:hypothetical protein